MHQARCAMGIPLIWLRIMAFPLLTLRQSGACETSANESFYGGRKKISLLNLGIPIKTARKTAINISARGKMGRGKKPLSGRWTVVSPTNRFASVPFANVLCRSTEKRNERCSCLCFVLSAMIQKSTYDRHVYTSFFQTLISGESC